MRIEQIAPPVSPKTDWTLTLEDGSTLHAYADAMIDFSLHTGMELSDEQLNALRRAASRTKFQDRTVKLLSLRPYSQRELRKKLLSQGASAEETEEILSWAENLGLLCDLDYAKSIVHTYSTRGYGVYKIRDELYRRGIPKSLWEEALKALPEPDAAIDAYLDLHLNRNDRNAIKRAADTLARRGYSWSDISDGLRRHHIPDELHDYEV